MAADLVYSVPSSFVIFREAGSPVSIYEGNDSGVFVGFEFCHVVEVETVFCLHVVIVVEHEVE